MNTLNSRNLLLSTLRLLRTMRALVFLLLVACGSADPVERSEEQPTGFDLKSPDMSIPTPKPVPVEEEPLPAVRRVSATRPVQPVLK